MNYLSSFKRLSRAKQVAAILIASTLSGVFGVPLLFQTASAAQVSSISMTASSSNPTTATNYMLRYTSTTTVATGQTIKVTFSFGNTGGANEYDLSTFTTADVVGLSGVAVLAGACGGVTANQVSISGGISNVAGNRALTFTACGPVAAQQITFGFINNHIINPTTTGSYKINVAGTQTDSGTTMTAILSQVTVTASVDTTLTFIVTGVATGGSVNGETISTTTSATAIGFGTVASGTPVVAAQDLSVTTNAANGYIVTVREDQDLTSANGSSIKLFRDGAQTATPIGWATPTAVLGNPSTYGHIGITSSDTDLNANEFFSGGVIKWAGNFQSTSTRTIMSNSGPADGVTAAIGAVRVGYKILVSALQPAATDYSNRLIYVCTPTF